MIILIPNSFIQERTYIIDFFFNHLELKYEIIVDNSIHDYIIKTSKGELHIKDSFFDSLDTKKMYFEYKNIPNTFFWFYYPDLIEDKIPILYGNDYLKISDSQIHCGADIFASAFFMLTRWEEIVLTKDEFGRCDESEMFVVKNNLYKRPIVDEYVNLLRVLLGKVGVSVCEREKGIKPFITHDIDYLFRYASFKNFVSNIAGDILHRFSLKALYFTLLNYIKFKLGKIKDPFDTFDMIMDISEKQGIRNAFYFKAATIGEYDYTYDIFDKRVKGIIDNIIARGHEVGIHPSKNTFHNASQFDEEVRRLRSLNIEIIGGRQHFLLYDLPDTMDNWENNNFEYDAGLGFAFRGGFRCGTCHQYQFFNVKQRKKLNLLIRPLILMEGALLRHSHERSLEELIIEMKELINTVYHFNGEFVFLWHNDYFYRYETVNQSFIYNEVVKLIFDLIKSDKQ